MSEDRDRYDELPYTCYPLPITYPDNMACKALWYGVQAPPLERCRVLELGCGTGGNLIPLAAVMPNAECVGIDYSPKQIELALAATQKTGVQNVRFLPLSLSEVTKELGEFDYIICHGVFSWVAREFQEHIFRIMQELLTPQGLGYISYNTYPGWHLRGVIRDIFNFPARSGSAGEQVRRARAYFDFISKNLLEKNDSYAHLLNHEANTLKPMPDAYIFHEHMEIVNEPIYFHQFMARASGYGLQYVGDARFSPQEAKLAPELAARVQSYSRNRVDYEQHLDFLFGGMFRRSILCRSDLKVGPQKPDQVVPHFRMSGIAVPQNKTLDSFSDTPEEFRCQKEINLTTSSPLMKTLLKLLYESRPRSFTFTELTAEIMARFEAFPHLKAGVSPDRIAANVLRLDQNQCIEVTMSNPTVATRISAQPAVSAVTRWQAMTPDPISTRRHRIAEITQADRVVIAMLDGQRDHKMLSEGVLQQIQRGGVKVENKGQPVQDPAQLQRISEQVVAAALRRCLEQGLLIS